MFQGTFDVVVVNLYPFYAKVTSDEGVEFDDGIENIDIGGPTMIRAAAKVVIVDKYSFMCHCYCYVCSMHQSKYSIYIE